MTASRVLSVLVTRTAGTSTRTRKRSYNVLQRALSNKQTQREQMSTLHISTAFNDQESLPDVPLRLARLPPSVRIKKGTGAKIEYGQTYQPSMPICNRAHGAPVTQQKSATTLDYGSHGKYIGHSNHLSTSRPSVSLRAKSCPAIYPVRIRGLRGRYTTH